MAEEKEKTFSELLDMLELQEDVLQFRHFTNSDAWELGSFMVQEARKNGIIVIPILYGSAEQDKHLEVYNRMYEKGIICASQSSVLDDFEKLLVSLIR